jgi:hypothetical protein
VYIMFFFFILYYFFKWIFYLSIIYFNYVDVKKILLENNF